MGAVKASHDSKELPCNRSRQLVSTSRSRCIVPAALIAARRRGPVVSTCGREHVSSHWPICSECRYLGRQILGGVGRSRTPTVRLAFSSSWDSNGQNYTNDNITRTTIDSGSNGAMGSAAFRTNTVTTGQTRSTFLPISLFIATNFTMAQGVDVCRGLVRRLGDHDFVGSTAYGNLQCNLAFCVFEQWT